MKNPLVLYSATTRLAYAIGQEYFGGVHYVWCAPARNPDIHAFQNPPSSDPILIYKELRQDIAGSDHHSKKISDNRNGILRGLREREAQNVISANVRAEAEAIVLAAPVTDFTPLLLVIPYYLVSDIVEAAPLDQRARASSREYVIKNLPRSSFDVIEF